MQVNIMPTYTIKATINRDDLKNGDFADVQTDITKDSRTDNDTPYQPLVEVLNLLRLMK